MHLKRAELDIHALRKAKKHVGEREPLLVCEESDAAVNRGNALVSERIDLLAEHMLKPKKTGCNEL